MYTFTTMTLYQGWGSDSQPFTSPAIVNEAAAPAWEEQINQLSNSPKSPKEKASVVEKLAKEYKPTTEELEEFKVHIVNEFINLRYLSDTSNDSYMLSNMFQAIALENHDVNLVRDFAEAFYHNTKNVYTGAVEPGSDSVLEYEEQMFKAINAGY
jgi:hypothetical protein